MRIGEAICYAVGALWLSGGVYVLLTRFDVLAVLLLAGLSTVSIAVGLFSRSFRRYLDEHPDQEEKLRERQAEVAKEPNPMDALILALGRGFGVVWLLDRLLALIDWVKRR
jgi:hypothetical protein